MTAHANIIVSGLVQGVGYRYFVARNAGALSLSGSAVNLANGEVEVHAQGEKGMIEELIRALRIGPRAAQVRKLTIEWLPVDPKMAGFHLG